MPEIIDYMTLNQCYYCELKLKLLKTFLFIKIKLKKTKVRNVEVEALTGNK